MKTCARRECQMPFDPGVRTFRKYCGPACSAMVRRANNVASTQRTRRAQRLLKPPTQKICAWGQCQRLYRLTHPAQRYCSPECHAARNRADASMRVRRGKLKRVMARHQT
jgi:hypothetical protein